MKKCSKCKVEKELDKFGKDKYTKDGLRYYCKQCATIKSKEWKNSNLQKAKDMMDKCISKIDPGVYMIKNLVNGKTYIGKSDKPYIRRISHLSIHRTKKGANNTNQWLQEDIHKYGKKCFIFGIIEHCEKERLLEREQYYIRQMKPEYNYGE